MFYVFSFVMGCMPEWSNRSETFPDNPLHDYDGDGLTEQNGDCDDLNPNISNGPWYADEDGDGFGFIDNFTTNCREKEEWGFVGNADDCNDSSASVFPGSARSEPELCAKDEDGDGYGDAAPSIPADPGSDCDDSDPKAYPGNNNEPGVICILDLDGDRFGDVDPPLPFDAGSDCDDALATVSPTAIEVCDEIDNDCDSEVDELGAFGALLWFIDADEDGFGNSEISVFACEQPAGYTNVGTDCNDSFGSIWPGAIEYCNEVDDNCDEEIDEDTAIDAPEWFQDIDGDGYGNPGFSQPSCSPLSGYVSNSEDCNDQESLISPSATEVCDSIDNNCDGSTDQSDAQGAPEWFQDLDGDGYGSQYFSSISCNQPVGYISDSSDCDDGDPLQNPGATEYCNFDDDDCDGSIDEEDSVDRSIHYIDADLDGYGDINFAQVTDGTILECHSNGPPIGYSSTSDDCDDSSPSVNPESNWYVDSDGDGFGDPSITFQSCLVPYGFVALSDDCDDNNPLINPDGIEICDGYNNACAGGNSDVPEIETDDDGDGYIECIPDVELYLWGDSITPIGGGDCEDDDPNAYPDAIETCNGVFENCTDPLYGVQAAPDDELDDDGDTFVECQYDASYWEGDLLVTGGDDCRDSNEYTYPGAAYLTSTTACTTDSDGDGYSDCERTTCDYGLPMSTAIGPDFVMIPAGDDPLGRYTLTTDFYMSTTEVTQGQFEELMGYNPESVPGYLQQGEDKPLAHIDFHQAKAFANALSQFEGIEACYLCSGAGSNVICINSLSYSGSSVLACEGYRLPTEAEWEYAARSGSSYDLWTSNGGGDIQGQEQGWDCGSSGMFLTDGTLQSSMGWFVCNRNYQGAMEVVATLQPNAFNLYDMHGNVEEWTADCWDEYNYPVSTVDPFNFSSGDCLISTRGGQIDSFPIALGAGVRSYWSPWSSSSDPKTGIRLVRTIP